MKKLLFFLMLSIAFSLELKAQDKHLRDTTIKDSTYCIWQGSKGGIYIVKLSRDQRLYKMYLKQRGINYHRRDTL